MSRFVEADRLLRLIVSQRRTCERCGGPGSQVAHIVRRGYAATRCREDNTWWLCSSCHDLVDARACQDNRPAFQAHADLVDRTIGRAAYQQLRVLAHAGPSEALSLFWPAERARLRDRCKALGLVYGRAS